MKVSLGQCRVRGVPRWYVSFPEGGKRRREFFGTRREAEQAFKLRGVDLRELGESWAMLSADERANLMSAWDSARELGIDLHEALSFYREQHGPDRSRVSLGKAIEALLQAKQAANRRPRYVQTLAWYLRQFAKGREDNLVAAITPATLESWFDGRKEPPASRAVNLSRLSVLFSFARRRGWIAENPCQRVERTVVERTPPAVLTPRQAALILAWTRRREPRMLGYLTLCLFAGLRPEEARVTSWRDIDLDQGLATVAAGSSKVRQRRIVQLQPAATAWLRVAKLANSVLPVTANAKREYVTRIKAAIGFWHPDILRHTAASYLVGLLGDAAKVALELGHSPQILFQHYRALVTPDQTRRFWSLLPRREATGSTPGAGARNRSSRANPETVPARRGAGRV